jgi:hypothetical protein
MGKLTKYSKNDLTKKFKNEVEINFMNGNSYKLTPLETLKIVATSSIFGEPQYYRKSKVSNKGIDRIKDFLLFDVKMFEETTEDVFEKCIEEALEYDFKGTLEFALELRKDYLMRLNPSVIIVKAIMHDKRVEFNVQNPGYLTDIAKEIINIPSDVTNMFEFFMFKNETKNNMPSILKRIMAKNLEKFSKYHIAKYKSKSLIDIVRISHANNDILNELMKTGNVDVPEEDMTWEKLKSSGKDWNYIINTINMPHMALLRNLRGIFSEKNEQIISVQEKDKLLDKLVSGVLNGKQFPFRYYTAYREIDNASEDIMYKKEIKKALEDCIDVAMGNFPKLKGKTISLSDNSGSAHGTFNSEFGSVKVSDIANLSSIMTAINSEEGYVGTFGDTLKIKEIKENKGVLKQHKKLDTEVGRGTENGIWMFFDQAIKNKEHWDNIFIYSDMQAGHGGLYGKNKKDYQDYTINGNYIDVLKLVDMYRKTVNKKVNIFSVQVAGYNNSVIPENLYRGAILGGWTGKEVLFAKKYIDFWDNKEKY